MAEKQFLDQEGLTELVSQTKSYVDSEVNAVNSEVNAITSVLHTKESYPYLKLESTDNFKEVQVMTDGYFDGDGSSGSGMGIKFQSKEDGGQDDPQSYGNLSLKADPRHGWNYVLTLPNETGTLATRNYVDDSRGIIVETVNLRVNVGQTTGSITPSNAVAKLEEVWQSYSGMKIPLIVTVVYPGDSVNVYVKRAILTDSQTNRYQSLVYGGNCDLNTFKWDGEGGTGVALSQALTSRTISMTSSSPAKLSIAFMRL